MSSSQTNPLEPYEGNYTILESGPTSTIARTWAGVGMEEPQLVAVKQATTVKRRTRCPHDIIKELDILQQCSHPNIIKVFDFVEDTIDESIQFWMPYIPYSLSELLECPFFSPALFHPVLLEPVTPDTPPAYIGKGWTAELLTRRQEMQSIIHGTLAQSLIAQILLAVGYLHEQQVAHRDLKPSNILITVTGCVKLIDFGVAYRVGEKERIGEDYRPMWPESREDNDMYFEVCTGAYRAPELLFGTRSYDPFAVDSWSLGCIFAEFFRPFRLYIGDDEDYEEDEENDPSPSDPPVLPPPQYIRPKGFRLEDLGANDNKRWIREPLFNGTRGELGLAWSIFKVKGTPTDQTWPGFKDLPHAGGVCFTYIPGDTPLESLLPNLSKSNPWKVDYGESFLDFLGQFLVYVPSQRVSPKTMPQHPFLKGILYPDDYPELTLATLGKTFDWEGRSTATWPLSRILALIFDGPTFRASEGEY